MIKINWQEIREQSNNEFVDYIKNGLKHDHGIIKKIVVTDAKDVLFVEILTLTDVYRFVYSYQRDRMWKRCIPVSTLRRLEVQ